MRSTLVDKGYQLDSDSDVWMRSGYGGIDYSDGDAVETGIASVVQNALDLSVLSSELRQHCIDWPSTYHLSSIRSNLLRPFKEILEGSEVLEIGAGCGAITRYMGEIGANVLALEGSPRRARIARSRTRDLSNVSVLAERFDEFNCEAKFDVVTLIGVLEYANLFTSADNPPLAMLSRARSFLKPNGRLILAIENQLGLKYFAGAPEDHVGLPMYGIEGRYCNSDPQTFGRIGLSTLLKNAGFVTQEFLAPFPDYKLPVSIITESGALADDFDAAALAVQSVKKDLQLPQRVLFSLEMAWPVIFQNGLMMDLANSFLVLSSPGTEKFLNSNSMGYHYSTDRAPAYCKEKQFLRTVDGIKVNSRFVSGAEGRDDLTDKAFTIGNHAETTYVLGTPLSSQFVRIVSTSGWKIDQCANFFKTYLDQLMVCLRSENVEVPAFCQESVLPGHYLDAIPSNIIVGADGRYHYIDSEWCASGGVRLKYLLFRSVMSLLGGISLFAKANEGEPNTRGEFLIRVMGLLGFSISETEISDFLKIESSLNAFASGVVNRQFSTWSPEGSLPGYERTSFDELERRLVLAIDSKNYAEEIAFARYDEVVSLSRQLAQMEEAKSVAENWAATHLSELHRVQLQLSMTENAKTKAEEIVDQYCVELTQIKRRLFEIEQSKPYQFLQAIKLAPGGGDA